MAAQSAAAAAATTTAQTTRAEMFIFSWGSASFPEIVYAAAQRPKSLAAKVQRIWRIAVKR